MKFKDGYWMTKKHYHIKAAGSAYEASATDSKLEIMTTPGKIYNRGMTLGGANINITVTSPMPNVIGIRAVYHSGIKVKTPDFNLNKVDGFEPEISITDKVAVLKSGDSRVEIELDGGWNMRFYTNNTLMTSSEGCSLAAVEPDAVAREAYTKLDEDKYPWSMPSTSALYMRECLTLDVGEKIYGLGERFGALVKNGQSADMWNADGGTSSEFSYKNIPFYLTSKGYGVFVANPGAVSFEAGSEVVETVNFTVPENVLEYYFIGGGSPKAAISNYTALTGRPALPPAYTFGLWLTTSFTTSYDEATVTSFIDGMAERDIPLSVFHFDCFWMREFQWCDFEWDSRMFAEPVEMIRRLKSRGLHLCVWVNPYVSEHSPLFKVGCENGYFIKYANGDVYQSDEWQPGMAVVDFTNPEACEWYASKIRALIESGVDCIKTDFGERIPVDVVYHDHSDPLRMHNYYTYLYNKTVFGELRDGCLFARSATVGGQQFPAHWGGDCSATYPSMAETLRGGLSLAASGFGYFSHDISGFEATATPDIYKRWSAFGLLSTHSRLHGSSSYRVPWLFDDEAVDVLRFFVNLKGRLMPYIYSEAVACSKTGVPVMRPMMMDFPDDIAALDCDRQYMFGDSLLIAPIFNDKGIADFYVPSIEPDTNSDRAWYDLLSGERFVGGLYYRRKYDYFGLPILVRPHSMVVQGDFTGDFDYDYTDNVVVYVGWLDDGQCATTTVYKTDGTSVKFAAKRTDDSIIVTCDDNDVSYDVVSMQGCVIQAKSR